MPNHDIFDRAIPGQSLTKPVGGAKYEQPPKYVDEDEASSAMLDSITSKKNAPVIAGLLSRGAYASEIANTLLMTGVAEGKFTPDMAVLLAKRTLASVVAVGHKAGIKDMKYKKPDPEREKMMEQIMSLPKSLENEPVITKDPIYREGPPPSLENEPVITKDKPKGAMGI